MGTQQTYIIVGNGISGVTAAEILRAEDTTCAITIIADDPFPAYYRPALKDFLGGRLPEERLWARPATFYQDQGIRFIPGRVVGINIMQHFVQLHNGKNIGYSKLLLANGARPRALSCPGLNLAGVSTLRTVADYQEILRRLSNVNRVLVCGSGTLALESAETLRHRNYQVTHLIRGNTLWSEVLDPIASDLVLQEERRDGIDVRTGEEIAQIVGKHGQVSGVITTHGEHISCEMVLIAIGIEPEIDFIRASGIACGRGVKVDNGMCTNIPHIYAAGDVIETTDEFSGRTRVLGQWFPAIQQAQIAAYNMLGLFTPDHPFYPGSNSELRKAYLNYYNATFLYGLDFVSIGLTTRPSSAGYQEIVADPEPRCYRKVVLKNGIVTGALLLGERVHALAFKRAIDHRVNVAPIASQLFAANFELDAWLDQQSIPGPILNIKKEGVSEDSTFGKHGMIPGLTSEEYTQNLFPKDMDAFFILVPHPKVDVPMTEVQLSNNGQANVMTVGRQAGVSLLLEHSSVSRLHAEIITHDSEYLLRDTGSSNGTFINGSPVASDTVYKLHHHDRVRFGDVQFRFELRPQTAHTSHLGASTPAGSDGTELHASISRIIPENVLRTLDDIPTLVLVGPDTAPEVIRLVYGRRYTLGRDKQNDIVLVDTSSSRQHAEIFTAPDGFYVRDLNSRYGVFVNKLKINNAYCLSHGDRIVLGNYLVYFSYPQRSVIKQSATSRLQETPPSGILKDEIVITSGINRGSTTALHSLLAEKEPVVVGIEHRQAMQRLGKDRINFEIDMCIGCNRCMDACPVPISSQVTIADLNSATISEGVASHVSRFTQECIMCGSCVPVCPVDNHRDLLMLSLKERLGVSWNSRPDMDRVADKLPVGWTFAVLISRLREQAILRDPRQVPDTYLLHILAASIQRILAPGETLICEGEYGRDLYLILEGRLELTMTGIDNYELPVAILRRGEYAGEDGMLTGHPYKATVCAQKPTLLLQVPEQVVQRLMELVPGVRHHFESLNNAYSLKSILKRLALFQGVADADISSLVHQTPVKQYERDKRLFAEDKKGRPSRETLHILLEGFVKVARQYKSDERIIAYRQGGDYFAGGLDLLGDGQAVTVTTINRCRVAEVPRQALLALFQKYPEVDHRFSMRLREYFASAFFTQGYAQSTGYLPHFMSEWGSADPGVQEGLHSLVNDGVVEGTEVLVIDLDKCIHCNECEEACARRHGHSRMNRKGMVVGNISIATACRQCQDPVCMLCSRAGIARHPDGEVYITESCIGCGICAERCPYGAISIVQIDDEAGARNSWQRFSEFFTKGAGKERARKTLPVVSVNAAGGNYAAPGPLDITQPRSGYDELRKKVAIKCDLCAGYGDQACVQACPTGAAVRIQPAKFFGSTEEILQRSSR